LCSEKKVLTVDGIFACDNEETREMCVFFFCVLIAVSAFALDIIPIAISKKIILPKMVKNNCA
jgi:hypothetical protein